jgi:CheY-like chemotaxis protein
MKSEKPNVLLVEDSPADINLVEEALEQAEVDCRLHIVRDGARAFEFLEQLDAGQDRPVPDVVLLDLNLPKIGGEEVLKRVRKSPKCGRARVLIISSSDAPADRERMLKLGANDYFRKPSGLAQFMLLGIKVRAMIEDAAGACQ